MTKLAKFDELDNLRLRVERLVTENYKPTEVDLIDTVEDFLVAAFIFGMDYTNDLLGTTKKLSSDIVDEIINKKVADETWKERISDYYKTDDFSYYPTLLDTESMRVFNESSLATAKLNGATHKTWQTMEDFKVRDTHSYLQGVKLPIDEKFYTTDGDSTYRPFGFDYPQNNVNCRCYLEFSKEKVGE